MHYIPLLSETSLTVIIDILEAFCQCRRNSVTCLESGTNIARIRPWNEREGPRQGVQTAEAQFKVATSVVHIVKQIRNNIRPVESLTGFCHYIQPLFVIPRCLVELLREYLCAKFSCGLSLNTATEHHDRVSMLQLLIQEVPGSNFETDTGSSEFLVVFLCSSD